MARSLVNGLYEELVTRSLADAIQTHRAAGATLDVQESSDSLRAELLARHVYQLIRTAIENVPNDDDRVGRQVALANHLLDVIRQFGPKDSVLPGDDSGDLAHVLLGVHPALASHVTHTQAIRPKLSLRQSGLLVNGQRDYQVGGELVREIASADRIDLLCAFVKFSGLRLVREPLDAFVKRGGRIRVISTVYTGATEKRAIDELVKLGAEVKISYETAQTRLHAKAWLFHRNSSFSTAYVGSSNLSHAALVDGLEWNVRLSNVDNPGILDRFRAAFEQYWEEPEFITYDPERDGDRLGRALRDEHSTTPGSGGFVERLLALNLDVLPKPHQDEMLEALAAERSHGHHRNLVVAATGTGKTWVAGFDYRRLRDQGLDRLLFVAHREEILKQSQLIFQVILRDATFGELLVGGARPETGRHVFASIQSLARHVQKMSPDSFDVVIVDEFHHAAADTYDALLKRLQPKVLLGLTATPERTDGKPILHWFDGRIATENRLWEALEYGLLCPFHYFGVHDGTDLSGVTFQRGRYAAKELENVYTGDHVRAKRIVQAVADLVLEPKRMKALGFCVGVAHAHFMTKAFEAAGLRAVALDADTPDGERRAAVTRLRAGDLQAIFTVDLFNEGVDIPEVDTVLLLRPTDSATIFLQQLGRGLRWSPGKSVLTVLDFIGQAHAEFRFDVRYAALLGRPRRQVERAVEHDFPLLPPGCAVKLDRMAKDIVLDNVRRAVRSARRQLVADLRSLPQTTTLPEFLSATACEPAEVYGRPSEKSSFTALRREAGYEPTGPTVHEPTLAKALARLLHVDDEERLRTWEAWLRAYSPPTIETLTPRHRRVAMMLFAALGHRKRPVEELGNSFAELWRTDLLRREAADLIAVLSDRTRNEARPLDTAGPVPLATHATYSLYEIVAAYGLVSPSGALRETREGVLWAEEAKTDVLFVTLEKDDDDYSPTTRYADYPLSPLLFHWESQNSTAPSSATGRRYIEHATRGSNVVLFVRLRKKDDRGETAPYTCLGRSQYVRHESERPMKVVWQLERSMPAWVFEHGKVVAG
jgi:superfamily II DNA or RNA helicase/HKD family nuclease